MSNKLLAAAIVTQYDGMCVKAVGLHVFHSPFIFLTVIRCRPPPPPPPFLLPVTMLNHYQIQTITYISLGLESQLFPFSIASTYSILPLSLK